MVRLATLSITNKALEIGIEIMTNELKQAMFWAKVKKNDKLQELYQELNYYVDCSYTCQAIDVQKEIRVIENQIIEDVTNYNNN